jgi:hypothetical protein
MANGVIKIADPTPYCDQRLRNVMQHLQVLQMRTMHAACGGVTPASLQLRAS